MIDVYAIGTTLKLTDLVTPQLLKLSQEMMKLDALSLQVNKRFQKMGSEVAGFRNLGNATKRLDSNLKAAGDRALGVELNLISLKKALPAGQLTLDTELKGAAAGAAALGAELKGVTSNVPGVKATTRAFEAMAAALTTASMRAGTLHSHMQSIITAGGAIPTRLPGFGGAGGRGGLPGGGGGAGGGGGGRRGHVHGGNMHVGPNGFGIGGVGMGIASDMLVPLAAAGAALYVGKSMANEAGEYQREQAQFSIFGMSPAQNAEAKRYSEQTAMPGASLIDKMRYMTEAQGVFRESGMQGDEALSGAKLVAPILAKLHYTSLLSGHEMDETEEKAMLRFVETRGGLKDPKELAKIADMGFKVSMTSGGNVDWEQMRAAMMTGGIAAKSLNDEALFAWGEPLMGELKGGGFGTGLRTAFNRMNGIVKLPNQAYHEMERLKLWDPSKVVENANGGIKSFKGNPLVHADEYATNPFKYYVDYIKPKYDKMGMSEPERNTENAILFGGTGARLFSTLEQQLSTIMNSLPALNQAKGLDPAVKVTTDTLTGQEKEFQAAWSDFKNVFGQTILPAVTNMLTVGTSILKTISGIASGPVSAAQAQINQVPQADHSVVRPWGALTPYLPSWMPGAGNQPAINPVEDKKPAPAAMHGVVNLDGRKVGNFAADHIGRMANAPQHMSGTFDPSMNLQPFALNLR